MTDYIDEEELNEIFSYLIGLTIKDDINIIGHDMSIRELRRNDIIFPIDEFYKDYRLNVEVDNGRISKIKYIG